MLSLDEILRVRPTVMEVATRTPLLRLPGTEIHLKLENLQPIGAFKLRGAWAQIQALRPGAVLTASAGNMARGVAWCAHRMGIPCTVVVPEGAPQAKIGPVEALGARVIPVPFERWWQTFEDRAFPGEEGTFVHPFDHPMMLAGNATIGLEILEDLPEVETVLVPWGGGGLACGIASAVRALRPGTRVLATEVDTAAPLTASWEAGRPMEVEVQRSFVDGIGGRSVFPGMFALARELLDGVLTATLEEIRDAIRILLQQAHVLAEGAGACPVAVARRLEAPAVCVVSGGNLDASVLAELLA